MVVTNTMEIPLTQKLVPLSELPPAIASEFPIVVERQRDIDITGLQERIHAGGEELWEPAHQKENVPIQRAGHDRWGIGKVVFIFCDDYINTVYEFPWFAQWKKELEAVFKQVGIPVDRVIRCIFARMPAGSVVPVHHDTGAWVCKSHRMHIPIFTDPAIDFSVGINTESMERQAFEQGCLYELNNASKHCVTNHWDQPRVHLIFDYVEPSYPLTRMLLTPDMVLHQTRRTLDLSTDAGSRPAPSFMVIGVQKAGTTSLYDYITQHDLVAPARRKETHYFDWRWNGALPTMYSPEGAAQHHAYYLNFFEKDLLHKCPSVLTGEATPSYLLGGSRVVQRMQHVIPHCRKILVILRDPVDRAYSQYCMTADPEGNAAQLKNRGHHHLGGKSFEQVVEQEIQELRALGVHADMSAKDFDAKVLSETVACEHGGHSFVARGLYALQLQLWLDAYGRDDVMVLSLEDDLKNPKKSPSEVVEEVETVVQNRLQHTMDNVYEFLGLPPHRVEDSSAKNTRKYEPLSPKTRATLEAFYAPFNAKLDELLDSKFAWSA